MAPVLARAASHLLPQFAGGCSSYTYPSGGVARKRLVRSAPERALGYISLPARMSQRGIQAEGARAVSREEQKDEREEHRGLAMVLKRQRAVRLMRGEVGPRHFTGQQERDWTREESGQDGEAAEEFQNSRDAHQGRQLDR